MKYFSWTISAFLFIALIISIISNRSIVLFEDEMVLSPPLPKYLATYPGKGSEGVEVWIYVGTLDGNNIWFGNDGLIALTSEKRNPVVMTTPQNFQNLVIYENDKISYDKPWQDKF